MDEEAQDWCREQLAVQRIETGRVRPWADVFRVVTAEGWYWLKINKSATIHEPPLLRVLARSGDRLIPPVIVHPTQPWSLIADAGRPLHAAGLSEPQLVTLWSDLLAAYARLQRQVGVDQLLAAGVPDFRAATLVSRYDDLLRRREWFEPPAVDDFGGADRQAAGDFRPRLAALAAELAEGVAPAIQHDDLHDGNVLIASSQRSSGAPGAPGDPSPDLADVRLIDWGDAVVTHPFATLRLSLSTLADRLHRPVTDPAITRVRDAYLEAWQGDGWSRTDLVGQVDLAWRLEALVRAHGWIRAVGTPAAAVAAGHGGSVAYWTRELIAPSQQ